MCSTPRCDNKINHNFLVAVQVYYCVKIITRYLHANDGVDEKQHTNEQYYIWQSLHNINTVELSYN